MLAPNTLLHNRYLVMHQLGQGGMGAVYLATDQTFGSTVALKETLIVDEHLRKAFEREARLLNSLHHAALPHVFDYFFEGSGQFLVMQFIPGEDLGQQLKRGQRPFPADAVLKWTDQLLDLLDYLHSHEPPIIHRDIKPENLKLTQRGDIILLDFGLAKGSVDQMTAVSSQSLFGYTPHYAPFEQIRGTGTDPRSDLYSLAATVVHLLSGRLPPDALTRAESILNGETDPLAYVPAMLPMVTPAVANVLHRALAQKRDQRYPSAAAMRADLTSALRSVPPTVKVPVPYVPTTGEGATPTAPGQSPPTLPSPTPATTPLFPSNPQTAPPAYPSNPPAPSYPPVYHPQPQTQPTPPYPQAPPTMRAPYPTPSQAPRSGGGAKVWIGLAVAVVALVAIAAVAALVIVPRLLQPANTNAANANASPANANRGTDAGPVVKTLAPVRSISAPNTVLRVAVSGDGALVASSGEENTVRVWKAGDGSLSLALVGQTKPSRALGFSPDGVYLASGADDGTVRIWKAGDGTEVRSFKAHDAAVFILGYSGDGSRLLTAGNDKTVKIWRADDGSAATTLAAPDANALIVDVSPNLSRVAYFNGDKSVTIWSVDNKKEGAKLDGRTSNLSAGAFSPDGSQLALGAADGVVRVWNASNGTLVREMKAAGGAVSRLAWSPDGKLLASGSDDGTIRLWSAGDGAKLFEGAGHKSPVNSIAFSADGRTLASGSSDRTIQLWAVSDKK